MTHIPSLPFAFVDSADEVWPTKCGLPMKVSMYAAQNESEGPCRKCQPRIRRTRRTQQQRA